MDSIKEIVKSLVENLGVKEVSIEVVDHNGGFLVNIKSPEEYSLIGRENEKFEAISHLIKRMVAKRHGEDMKVTIDINGVKAQNDEHLKNKASMLAERAKSFKIDVEMDPMTSYERMIIHAHLEGKPNIKTESIGEGRNRRLVIKYIEDTSETI